MKTVFFEVEEWEKPILTEAFPDCIMVHERLDESNVSQFEDVEIASCFIYSKFNAAVLEKLPNLKMIATRSTGYDHIDTDVTKSREICVVNVPEYGSVTVAEHTFALIINLTRKIYQSVNQAKQLHFDHLNLRGIDLYGKTLGVIGLGKIGTHVVQIAKGFGMNVIVTNRSHHEDLAKKHGFSYVELDELLAQSDIVTLHLPYNEHTHHTINEENIMKMKKGSYLINTARGGLVETEAVVEALNEGILEGVGLDVLEGENDMTEEVEVLTHQFRKKDELKTLVLNHMLINHPNVLITPHNAFNSIEALMRIENTTIDNIKNYLKGTPSNCII
ncbi:MAG: NAD(P)-dependent oxidoreductase [Patescibacteria group bacterium]